MSTDHTPPDLQAPPRHAMEHLPFRAELARFARRRGATLRWRMAIHHGCPFYELFFVGIAPTHASDVQIRVAQQMMDKGLHRGAVVGVYCNTEEAFRAALTDRGFEGLYHVCTTCGAVPVRCARCAASRGGGVYCPTCDVDTCVSDQSGIFDVREGVKALVVYNHIVQDFPATELARFLGVIRNPRGWH